MSPPVGLVDPVEVYLVVGLEPFGLNEDSQVGGELYPVKEDPSSLHCSPLGLHEAPHHAALSVGRKAEIGREFGIYI